MKHQSLNYHTVVATDLGMMELPGMRLCARIIWTLPHNCVNTAKSNELHIIHPFHQRYFVVHHEFSSLFGIYTFRNKF